MSRYGGDVPLVSGKERATRFAALTRLRRQWGGPPLESLCWAYGDVLYDSRAAPAVTCEQTVLAKML